MGSGSAFGRAWRAGRQDCRLHLLSVFSLAVAFVCLASALLVVTNLQAVRARWAHAGRVSVYLRDGAGEADLRALDGALRQAPGVTTTRYVSREEARRDIVQAGVEGALATLPDDAYPASIEVDLDESMGEADLAALAGKIRQVPAVESVETYQRWTDRLSSLLRGGVAASALLAIVVFGAVVSVVASTMRLALERRRTEVEVLRLVGATDDYVRRPYVVEGAAQGALGAVAAIALLGALYLIVRGRFDGDLAAVLGLLPSFLPWFVSMGLVVLGAALGAGPAFTTVRRLARA